MAANSECTVFGSGEVFAEFDSVPSAESAPNAESVKKKSRKKSALDKKISRLVAENERLKEKLKMIIQPRGVHIEDGRYDGPIAQVMFMNHSIVRKYRQEIEDFFEELAQKHIEGDHQQEQNFPQPQSSSVKLLTDVDPEKKEAFTAVGNVQFFNQFCIDKIGKPLLNGNPRLTVGWCIPDYEQMFSESLPEDDQPSGKKKRQKACCFNCGEDDHGVRDCPQPQDLARISMNKKKFQMSLPNIPTSKRYHLDEENVEKFKAGVVSEELRSALGLKPNQLPLHIYQMRVYGYSPGHLKEAEAVKSGLTVYDNHDGSVGGRQTEQQPDYDHDKLICFPGFNVDVPHDMHDVSTNVFPTLSHLKGILKIEQGAVSHRSSVSTCVSKEMN
ncbi:zinc finger CCHC domain-containing protein 8-like [Anneissia japonica]|uniref:zinc finger CCHC domain-containing protein 8-like n=1 Tax=Anneissia japonica TaxID=1529436 RepID=UPI001425AF6E|nr:zinc finger CCHC domain-containing protein 8-like [Anneissia japonica]